MNGWISISDYHLDVGVAVIGYNKKWIDVDINPNGTRECFLQDDGTWISAEWNNYQDTYQNSVSTPTHFALIPARPED